jgi:hypothetical protein
LKSRYYKIWNFIYKLFFSGSIIFISTTSLNGTEPDLLFRSEEVLNIEIRSDFSSILNDRDYNPEDHPGVLILFLAAGSEEKYEIIITTRGNFRLKPENCEFPPLLINFRKNEVTNTVFEGQNKLKLVTPCQGENEVIEEYIVYKMYNLVTDLSFGARLARITYYDTSKNRILFTKHSFFIEDAGDVAIRNKCSETTRFLTPFSLESENYKKLSLFQYMIGNTDWFSVSRKNMIILQPDDTSMAPLAVPYDFDFSGFVNAAYSIPDYLPYTMVPEKRVYKGICYKPDELVETFAFYRNIRPTLEAVIRNQQLLQASDKSYLLKYIGQFYRIIENKKLSIREFNSTCETRKDYNLTAQSEHDKLLKANIF